MPGTRHVVAVAAAFGLLGDVLFFRSGVGLNLALWLEALAVAGWWIARRAGRSSGTLATLLGIGAFFGACLAWRASPFLRLWSLVAIGAVIATTAVHLRGVLYTARIADYGRGVMNVVSDLVRGPVRLAASLPPAQAGGVAHGPAIARGALLAVPILLVFGALLAAADPTMEAFVTRLFAWDPEALATHLGLFALAAWLAGGGLWRLGLAPPAPAPTQAKVHRTLGRIELTIPLGALTVLLAAFIGLQARYLFGGETFVRLSGITYAGFARRGFFELVTLAALVLPVLLAAQQVVNRDDPTALESFRALAATVALLVALVMVSALARMALYVRMYGLTEDRFYATAFMAWVGVVLVWFVGTELRGRLDRFAGGAVLAGFLLLGTLHAVNPDAVIARVNLNRAAAGAALDGAYLARLSTDAVPVLAHRWSALTADARCTVVTGVRRGAERQAGWRAWTWSTWRANRAVRRLPQPACAAG